MKRNCIYLFVDMIIMIFYIPMLGYSNNFIINYKIHHPDLSLDNKTPLIIEFNYTGTQTYTEKIVSYPMIHLFYDQNNRIESKACWTLYQDAFLFPDGKGIVLITKKSKYESNDNIEFIEIFYQHNHGYIEHPKGSEIYWSKDGKYLVIVSFPSPYGESKESIKTYYYSQDKFIEEKEVSNYRKFIELSLIKAK